MTESEWLTTDDVAAMLRHVIGEAADLPDAIDMARRGTTRPPLVSGRKMRLFVDACRHKFFHGRLEESGIWSGWESDDHMKSRSREDGIPAGRAARLWASEVSMQPWKAALARCIVGNPWRPVRCRWCAGDGLASHENDEDKCQLCGGSGGLPRRWLTPAVIAVARAIYDGNLWHQAGVLADALEEAGCPATERYQDEKGGPLPDFVRPHPLLAHLRSPGPHARGCWAVDLILDRHSPSTEGGVS